MSKERYEREHEWIIDNNKRKTKESIIVYDEEWNTLDDICELLNRQDKTIADLEAKLTEKDSEIKVGEFWHSAYQGKQLDYDKVYAELRQSYDENEKLKQHLAEKDRQIEQLKKFDDLNKTFFDLFRTAFKEPNKVDDLFNTLKTMQEKQDQDKISFAVEQLEKVKAELVNKVSPVKLSYNEYVQGVFSKIDNQIKQLKEMK